MKKKRVIEEREVRAFGLSYWLPRVLMIVFIAFISLFALDTLHYGSFSWTNFVDFLVHLIPSVILAASLLVVWKQDTLGGIVFLFLGVVFTIFFETYERLSFFLVLSGPVFLSGILFLINGVRRIR